MKIVVNHCYGGFGLSEKALAILGTEKDWDNNRNDPELVRVVEQMGKAANYGYANLVVMEVPDGVEYHIFDYDGYETLITGHGLKVW